MAAERRVVVVMRLFAALALVTCLPLSSELCANMLWADTYSDRSPY